MTKQGKEDALETFGTVFFLGALTFTRAIGLIVPVLLGTTMMIAFLMVEPGLCELRQHLFDNRAVQTYDFSQTPATTLTEGDR